MASVSSAVFGTPANDIETRLRQLAAAAKIDPNEAACRLTGRDAVDEFYKALFGPQITYLAAGRMVDRLPSTPRQTRLDRNVEGYCVHRSKLTANEPEIGLLAFQIQQIEVYLKYIRTAANSPLRLLGWSLSLTAAETIEA